jgi:hypothetical protein
LRAVLEERFKGSKFTVREETLNDTETTFWLTRLHNFDIQFGRHNIILGRQIQSLCDCDRVPEVSFLQVIVVVQRKEDVDQLLEAGSLNKPLGWGLVLFLAVATIARCVRA